MTLWYPKSQISGIISQYWYNIYTSPNTYNHTVLKTAVPTIHSLHISPLIPSLDSLAPINSFLLNRENGCPRQSASHQQCVLKTTFSPPYPEHGKLPSILGDTIALGDNDFRASHCGRRDHLLTSAHVGPYINLGEGLTSTRPCLPACPVTYLVGWLAT